MHWQLPFILLSYAIGSGAVPSSQKHVLKESHTVPGFWIEAGDAPKQSILQLQIGLKQTDDNILETHLLEVSDPEHARYKQHLTLDDVVRLTQPSKEVQSQVETWLRDHGIAHYTWNEPARDWISAKVTVEMAETLLQTKYSTFVHVESSAHVYRTREWSLPAHLHGHIDIVQPTTSFFGAALKSSRVDEPNVNLRSRHVEQRDPADDTKACKAYTKTPDCIRTLYGTIDVCVTLRDRCTTLISMPQ